VLLSLVGVAQFPSYLPVVVVTAVLVVAGVIVLGSPRLLHAVLRFCAKVPGLRRLSGRAAPLVESTAVLLRIRVLLVLSAISVVGWGLECIGFWLIVGGFGIDASLLLCTFLWAAGTLVGALSFLPG